MVTDPVQSFVTRARASVLAALQEGDVEGHLAAVVLRRRPPAWAAETTAAMLAQPAPSLARTRGVAVTGLRGLLGSPAKDSETLREAAAREWSRAPNPNVIRAEDDERLLLGVAATGSLSTGRGPGRGSPPRARVVRLWADALARGGLDAEAVAPAAEVVLSSARVPADFPDAVALFWLAAELMDSPWRPTDADLAELGEAVARWRGTVVLEAPDELGALDSAWALLALASSPSSAVVTRSALDAVVAVVEGFPAAAQILARRPRQRPPLILEDEYDVQWLLHALLLPLVPDLVPEDPTPKLAGASSRLDFTSRAAKLGVELKVVYTEGDVPRRRKELMVDERTYQEHPYVEAVVCFVHDPHGHLALSERAVFERDLSGPITVGGRTVNYVVRVR